VFFFRCDEGVDFGGVAADDGHVGVEAAEVAVDDLRDLAQLRLVAVAHRATRFLVCRVSWCEEAECGQTGMLFCRLVKEFSVLPSSTLQVGDACASPSVPFSQLSALLDEGGDRIVSGIRRLSGGALGDDLAEMLQRPLCCHLLPRQRLQQACLDGFGDQGQRLPRGW